MTKIQRRLHEYLLKKPQLRLIRLSDKSGRGTDRWGELINGREMDLCRVSTIRGLVNAGVLRMVGKWEAYLLSVSLRATRVR